MEVDVAECIFTVWEDGKVVWKGGDYKHAFFLRAVNPAIRKVTVNAKVDIALENMDDVMSAMKEPDGNA